jgi:hypothetical protein
MFKKINFLLFVISSFLFSITLEAVEIKDLYQASVPINSQNSRDRAVALKKALAAVMLKVGGGKGVLENETIKRSLNNYNLYLSQYRYQQKTLNVIGGVENKKQLFLLASFNEEKVNQLFQEANLPLWGSLRPNVLLWLIDEKGLNRNIISNSSSSSLPQAINAFSNERGLPIMMPLMDFTDANQIKTSDIWGRFQQPIEEASSRYLAEAIVVIRISDSSLVDAQDTKTSDFQSDDCGLLCVETTENTYKYVLDWSLLNWSLVAGQQKVSQQYQGDDPQALLTLGLSDITELIYQHYALSTTNQNDFVIDVANVDTLSQYVEVFDFLSDLSSVKSVVLLSAKGNVRRFNLQLLGSKEAFIASLKLNKQLTQMVDPLAQFNEPTLLKENTMQFVPIFNWGK